MCSAQPLIFVNNRLRAAQLDLERTAEGLREARRKLREVEAIVHETEHRHEETASYNSVVMRFTPFLSVCTGKGAYAVARAAGERKSASRASSKFVEEPGETAGRLDKPRSRLNDETLTAVRCHALCSRSANKNPLSTGERLFALRCHDGIRWLLFIPRTHSFPARVTCSCGSAFVACERYNSVFVNLGGAKIF